MILIRYLLISLVCINSYSLFAQKEKEWKVKNAQGTLYGTYCWHPKKEIKAVALIIAGSGPTDRNGNSGLTQNNALRFLAEELAKHGIASLRYDKQGVGKSSGAAKNEADLLFSDFVDDAILWLNIITKKHPKHKKIIIGHSEGALIAKLVAKKTPVNGIISIAGAGRPIGTILKEQLETALKDDERMLTYAKNAIDSLEAGHMVQNIEPMLISLFRPSVQPYLISWMQYDPLEVIKSLSIPALILQGNKDLQTGISDAERLSKAPNASQLIIENMNHVLKEIKDDTTANQMSYLNPSLPLHPMLIPAIIRFIAQLT
ncbi:MAG: alpha/beta hydrolase [Crocinitomicaceae bacterium]|nr:alpha/beta hydrolase [Crocinitomicaceae bacterium]